jgi:hypothetical protein
MPWSIKVRYNTKLTIVQRRFGDARLTWSRAEINQFANKEGLPAAMDGAVDGVIDQELSQFQK